MTITVKDYGNISIHFFSNGSSCSSIYWDMFHSFWAVLLGNRVCLKIGLYLFLSAFICFISALISDGVTAPGETEIIDEKITKVVETKKEPVIDTTIVIKNGVADTTFTYKFRK